MSSRSTPVDNAELNSHFLKKSKVPDSSAELPIILLDFAHFVFVPR